MNIRSIITKPLRSAAIAGVAAALFVAPTSVFAASASTPVGQLTATQAPGACNDLGAVVNVSVSGGFASTLYTASAVRVANGPSSFTTNGSGAGSTSLVNVQPDAGGFTGNATVTVHAGTQAGTVSVYLDCASGGGKG